MVAWMVKIARKKLFFYPSVEKIYMKNIHLHTYMEYPERLLVNENLAI